MIARTGLTGARLKAADCLWAGLATHYCPAAKLPTLEAALAALAASAGGDPVDPAKVDAAITEAAGGYVRSTADLLLLLLLLPPPSPSRLHAAVA